MGRWRSLCREDMRTGVPRFRLGSSSSGRALTGPGIVERFRLVFDGRQTRPDEIRGWRMGTLVFSDSVKRLSGLLRIG